MAPQLLPRTDRTDRRRRPLAAAVLSVAALIASLIVLAPAPAHAGPIAAKRAEVVALVNQARAGAGCGAVRAVRSLNKAAQRHSSAMARAQRLTHQLPGEPAMMTRIRKAGFRGARGAGETVAQGATSPAMVVSMWLASPPHRAIMLDCSMRYVGVGIKLTRGRWWTADFAHR